MENLKHTTKVKSLIQGEVSIGTCALVELEVRELEQTKNELYESLILATKRLNQFLLHGKLEETHIYILNEEIRGFNKAINKATK